MAGTSTFANTTNEYMEGHSTVRPPLFDGTNYSYWKNRMRIWVRSQDRRIWKIVEEGDFVPTKKTTQKVDSKDVEVEVPKSEDEWNDEDWKKVSLNDKAINFLHCALSQSDYMKISTCNTAKEIWDKLCVTYEGTSHVKQSKINRLLHEYEIFKMKEEEKIEDMFERYSKIINGLNLLGRKLSEKEVIAKVLRSLTPKWNSKVSAVEEGRNYEVLTYDQLRGNLITYESVILNSQGEENKKKSLALKTSIPQEEEKDEDDEDEDQEFAFLLKRFNRLAQRKSFNFKGKSKEPKCFECGETGHIKPNCPKIQKRSKDKKAKKKQRAYISWGNESSASSDEDEEANLCLMANDDKVQSPKPPKNELQEEYDALLDQFAMLTQDFSSSKKKILDLEKEISVLKNENKTLGKQKCELSCDSCKLHLKEIDKLKSSLAKFNSSSKNLDKILSSQKHVNNREGLGYDPNKPSSSKKSLPTRKPVRQPQAQRQPSKIKREPTRRNFSYENVAFRKPPRQPYRPLTRMNNPNVICHYCNKVGHIAPVCFTKIRHISFQSQNLGWVPYGRLAHSNPRGPKYTWVPKSKF